MNVVMKSLFALLVAAVVVIGTVPVGAAVASPADLGTGPGPAQTGDGGTEPATPTSNATGPDATGTADGSETDANDSNGTVSGVEPGAQLAGVVGVQRTEVESEIGSRAFGQRVAAAASNDSKAAIVAGEVNSSRERLADLRDRLDELESARDAGEISEGRYVAETARVAAEINAVERRLEQSNETAMSLPADVWAAAGINTSNIDRLRNEARNLSGPEVSAIARSIGGDRSGRGLGDNVGPPGRNGGASGPAGPPDGTDAGSPADRAGNGSGGENSVSDRGSGNGAGGERGSENAPDRGSDNWESDDGETPQESEANRSDRGNGEDSGAGSGDGGPDSNPGTNDNSGSDNGSNDGEDNATDSDGANGDSPDDG